MQDQEQTQNKSRINEPRGSIPSLWTNLTKNRSKVTDDITQIQNKQE